MAGIAAAQRHGSIRRRCGRNGIRQWRDRAVARNALASGSASMPAAGATGDSISRRSGIKNMATPAGISGRRNWRNAVVNLARARATRAATKAKKRNQQQQQRRQNAASSPVNNNNNDKQNGGDGGWRGETSWHLKITNNGAGARGGVTAKAAASLWRWRSSAKWRGIMRRWAA